MKMKPRYRREVVEEILLQEFLPNDLILRSQQNDLQKSLTSGAPMRVNKDQV